MAPKRKKTDPPPTTSDSDPHGMFSNMVVFLIEDGVQRRRLQIWKQKLVQMGAKIEEKLHNGVTYVFAINSDALLQHMSKQRLKQLKGSVLLYQWLEESLRLGEKISEDLYDLKAALEKEKKPEKSLVADSKGGRLSSKDEMQQNTIRSSPVDLSKITIRSESNAEDSDLHGGLSSPIRYESNHSSSLVNGSPESDATDYDVTSEHSSSIYKPPDLNKNITEIFGKLINIYRALGDDRRSFSYYKAIPVIEKLPFKIESVDQVKHLPSIGKSMQEHIQEIITTGKLAKLEHFEHDEKVRTISLFGEVWGIGPTTAMKLYEKGYRSLEDLMREESLTHAQKLGLKYFDDIKQRIPRHEVQEMEKLLQKAGEEVLPGVLIICGGSYRRGKASCGDMDIVITHSDGKSQRGFLKKYVKHLKEIGFLKEDLVFSTHSEEAGKTSLSKVKRKKTAQAGYGSITGFLRGSQRRVLLQKSSGMVSISVNKHKLLMFHGTDSGVDTYFGLCTYSERELHHRIDFKVYPRDIYVFGLVAWTGNDVLNRRLRLLAESKGFRLDDTGLFPATKDTGGKRGSKGTASIKLYEEKDLFDFLGFPWLEPHERNL